MLAPSLIPLVLAVVLVMIPNGMLEAVGAAEDWERELIRLFGVLLALHGLVTLSAHNVPGIGHSDPVIGRVSTVALVIAGLYLVRGNSFYLLISFALMAGISLNRAMKRLELAFERAEVRLKPKPPT